MKKNKTTAKKGDFQDKLLELMEKSLSPAQKKQLSMLENSEPEATSIEDFEVMTSHTGTIYAEQF